VTDIAGGVAVTAGRVIPDFAADSGQPDGYVVTLHFAQPVALPLGTPINPTVAEDDDSSHSPVPLSRHLPAAAVWNVLVNLDGTVNRVV
jgi:hypothetical protein